VFQNLEKPIEFSLTTKDLSSYFDMHTSYSVIKAWALDKDSQMFTQTEGAEVYSLLEMKLHTGKKHQLRLACSHALAAPILGDRKYGYVQANDLFRRSFKFTAIQERKLLVNTILLHSRELSVPIEPNSSSTKTFTCDYPDSFEKVLN